jgi:alcohol dehydrogenase
VTSVGYKRALWCGRVVRAAKDRVKSAIRPVMDRVFPFSSTNKALAYVEAGRAKGRSSSG